MSQLDTMRLPRFYKLSAGTKTDKTYEQFCDSPTTMHLLNLVVG